ncbi:hypothetical protein QJQ45_010197 [Haematococcus lacustris]|nr:hypothetical protein QJQ45_010197 [Haematococcus lacustris]
MHSHRRGQHGRGAVEPFAPHRSAALHRTISCASPASIASPVPPWPGLRTWEMHRGISPQADALSLVDSMLEDPALNLASMKGREAWRCYALDSPIPLHTGTAVHILGIVHDAPGNFYDIACVADKLQPHLVALEALPTQTRAFTAAARRLAPLLDQLSLCPMASDSQACRQLPLLDQQGTFVAEASRLRGMGNASMFDAAKANRHKALHSSRVTSGTVNGSSSSSSRRREGPSPHARHSRTPQLSREGPAPDNSPAPLPGAARTAQAMLVTGCPAMTEELAAAHASNRLLVPLHGIDLPAAKLAETMRLTSMLAELEQLLEQHVASRMEQQQQQQQPSSQQAGEGVHRQQREGAPLGSCVEELQRRSNCGLEHCRPGEGDGQLQVPEEQLRARVARVRRTPSGAAPPSTHPPLTPWIAA